MRSATPLSKPLLTLPRTPFRSGRPAASVDIAMDHPKREPGDYRFGEAPWMAIWEVTRACALACRHCRAEAMSQPAPGQLTTEEGLRLIDDIAACRPELLILTGGDPAMRRDLPELIEAAALKHGLRVALSPSATARFAQMDFQKLKDAGVARISMSLDGATPSVHDAFRGVPGTWVMTRRILDRIREAGISFQINTTFTSGTIPHFDAMRRLMDQIQPALWSAFLVVPTGRAQIAELPTPQEVEDLLVRLHDHACRVEYDVKMTACHHYRRVTLQRSGSLDRSARRAPPGINDGKGVVFISHTGEICPSGFLPLGAGNVRTSNLLGTYREHKLFRQLRDVSLLQGKCGVCEYNTVCGGSRARAYAVTGDYLGQEPLCAHRPAGLRGGLPKTVKTESYNA